MNSSKKLYHREKSLIHSPSCPQPSHRTVKLSRRRGRLSTPASWPCGKQHEDKAEGSGVTAMHSYFQFTFLKKSTFLFKLMYSVIGKKLLVCSASEEPGPDHTQIYPDFIWRHWRVPPELAYNRVFPWICRKAGDNAMHTSAVQEPFLQCSKGKLLFVFHVTSLWIQNKYLKNT